ncbi:MAG TPA: HYR domain-containing protein [Planctomycetes bacterium]|nr:HYR domain-containing protein [Planctomycetota bacterium]
MSSVSGTFFGIGETQITFTSTDVHGNSATTEMLLVVNDEEFPQIVNLPGTIIATPLPSTCTAPVTWAPLEFIDNCSGGTITSSVPSGSEFPVGVTEVLVTATDASGNSSSGSFTVTVEECFSDFIRGDANDDGAIDISDAIVIIGYIFLGTPSDCHDALDCNDSGNIDISDAIFHFNTLFQGGPPPPPPFDVCGLDPTEDPLVCELYQHCP